MFRDEMICASFTVTGKMLSYLHICFILIIFISIIIKPTITVNEIRGKNQDFFPVCRKHVHTLHTNRFLIHRKLRAICVEYYNRGYER